MTYANSLLNRSIFPCDIYDDDRMKLFIGRISNIKEIVRLLTGHNCYIDTSASDITRLEDGDVVFAFGDRLTIVSIGIIVGENLAGDHSRRIMQSTTTLTFMGVDDGFAVINEYI